MPKRPRKYRSKITPEMIAAIEAQYRAGEKLEYIASVHDVSMAAVGRIAKVAGLSRGRGVRMPREGGQ